MLHPHNIRIVSVNIKYKTVKGVDRKPAEVQIDIPAEMIYRLVHTLHDELQDPESIHNWEMIAMMFTRLLQHLAMQKHAAEFRPNPFFGPSGFNVGSVTAGPIRSIEDVKKFLEAAMSDVDNTQKFDNIFKDDKTEPEELRKKKKNIKVEGPTGAPPDEKNKKPDDENKDVV